MNAVTDMHSHRRKTSHANSLALDAIRAHFPALHQQVHGKPLAYLDNAATAQKPRAVIDTIEHYYAKDYSNVHRGVHYLAERATAAYEAARETTRNFINARDNREIVFVRGTTEAINLVAQTFGRSQFKPGDEILITELEHHANIVPWQILCDQIGTVLKVAPINDSGELNLAEFNKLLGTRTRLVAVTHISNALGTILPVAEIIKLAHAQDIPVLVDGAQAAPHQQVDVQQLNCDFYAFSGHKLFGPTGIGVLFGKQELLEAMPPYQGGGEMIRQVSFEKTVYAGIPHKFEAGTPHIVGAIGMGAAIDYISKIGLDNIARHEQALLEYATERMSNIQGLRIIGTAREKAGIISFTMDDAHPHDIGTILDSEGVAVRVGHHCAMPLMKRFGVPATARASFALYNTHEEVDALINGIKKVKEVFS
jgi:cysteine desulfurase/selenocysteine lyase